MLAFQASSFTSLRPTQPRGLLLCHHNRSSWRMATEISQGGITTPRGFKAAGYTAGFKTSGQPDLAVVLSDDNQPMNAAALFTKNMVRAAPVDLSEANWKRSGGKVSAIVLNSGQANAGTGVEGHDDAITTAAVTADLVGCDPSNIFLCSTGKIGERFDLQCMRSALPKIMASTSQEISAGTDAARAIMTTDLKMKQVAYTDTIAGKKVTVGGMCKGSGMIHPEMATMLGVVTCDAGVDQEVWQGMLKRAVDKSFNVITVDGDTSTNDVVCALCKDASGVVVNDSGSIQAQQLEELLTKTCIHLAKMIARDGEGATVLLEINVTGAENDEDARTIARTVAGSSLMKAAIFGHDPNWGRIAAAAGRAKAKLDPKQLRIAIGDHLLMDKGNPIPFDAAAASDYMAKKSKAGEEHYLSENDTVVISVQVGNGPGTGIAWGCDLSYKYVEINAEYST